MNYLESLQTVLDNYELKSWGFDLKDNGFNLGLILYQDGDVFTPEFVYQYDNVSLESVSFMLLTKANMQLANNSQTEN